MTFKEFLKKKRNETSTYKYYDPEGSNPKAVITRGLYKEILFRYKEYPSRLKALLSEFRGISTEIGWFIAVPFLSLLAPVIPILWGCISYRNAICLYKREYEKYLKENVN